MECHTAGDMESSAAKKKHIQELSSSSEESCGEENTHETSPSPPTKGKRTSTSSIMKTPAKRTKISPDDLWEAQVLKDTSLGVSTVTSVPSVTFVKGPANWKRVTQPITPITLGAHHVKMQCYDLENGSLSSLFNYAI